MKLCSRCHKNPAMIYIARVEGDKIIHEGLCLSCAKKIGVAPLHNMMEEMGTNEEEIDALNNQVANLVENMDELPSGNDFEEMLEGMSVGDENESGAAAVPLSFMSNFFNMHSPDRETSSPESKDTKKEKKKRSDRKKSMLETYGTNLTAKAAAGKVDRVINRDEEIERVIQIMNRRTKNNPVILGEPGVGKTAIAEGLACRVFEKRVPPKLFGCQPVSYTHLSRIVDNRTFIQG